jgi:hypothetical protein
VFIEESTGTLTLAISPVSNPREHHIQYGDDFIAFIFQRCNFITQQTVVDIRQFGWWA